MAADRHRRALLRGLAGCGLAWLGAAPQAAEPGERAIAIVARKFEFQPDEIELALGETVLLQFTAPDVPMGFNLSELGLRADLVPGRVTTLRLTADRPGRFIFACDVFCGGGHEDMNGMLIVSTAARG